MPRHQLLDGETGDGQEVLEVDDKHGLLLFDGVAYGPDRTHYKRVDSDGTVFSRSQK